MQPAISQVSTLGASFDRDLEGYGAARCGAVEIWLGKLETWLATHTLDDAKRLLAEHQLAAPVASFQGGLLLSQGDARREHWAHFARRLELCRGLSIGTLIVAGDIHGPLTEEDLGRVQVSLVQAAQQAEAAGLRLAFEFQAQAKFANNLETACALVAECDQPNLGICLDAFHFFTGPSKTEDLGYLTTANLFHVQLSDVSGVPREFAADSDRVLPGDGTFRLAPLVEYLKQMGYTGCVSLELMNPMIYQIPPRQLGEVGITALRKLLGLASMG
jgi:2-keto-myo-inositol isomerase